VHEGNYLQQTYSATGLFVLNHTLSTVKNIIDEVKLINRLSTIGLPAKQAMLRS